MKRILSLSILCFVLIPFLAYAQHTVSGEIKGEKNETLSNVSILFLSNDTVVGGTVSNEKGRYELRGLPMQEYQVRFQYIGYKSKEMAFRVDGNKRLNVRLEEDPVALKELSVQANRRDLVNMEAGSTTFYLSEKNKAKSKSVFDALKEIPTLHIVESERRILMADGSAPVILINGVKRGVTYEMIDPKNIEAVEVVDNPSAKYRGEEGDVTVLNIRVKRSLDLVHAMNVYGKQQINGKFGFYSANYAVEQDKFSLNLSVSDWYIHDEKAKNNYYTETPSLIRQWSGNNKNGANSFFVQGNGDWVISDNDYLSYGLTFSSNPSTSHLSERGLANRGNETYDMSVQGKTKSSYITGNYNVFYRHTFSDNRHFEGTVAFGHHNSGPEGWREESTIPLYSYYNDIKMNAYKQYARAELNYDFVVADKFSFNIGSNTYYQHVSIKELPYPKFPFHETREYVFADMRNKKKGKWSYMLSLGLDMVFRDVDGTQKSYVNVLPSLSLSYKTSQSSAIRLDLNRTRVSPGISDLNPRITTTDSLYVSEGNPYLKPTISNKAKLSYSLNAKKLYFQPFVQYVYRQDNVIPTAELVGDVYRNSFSNDGHSQDVSAGLTANLQIGNFGTISVSPTISKEMIEDMSFDGKSWGIDAWCSFYYKKVSLYAGAFYTRYMYTRTSRIKSSPMVEMNFTWSLPKGWSMILGLRDNVSHSKTWLRDGAYYSYSKYFGKDRSWTPSIGFSYYFRSSNKQRNKQYQDGSDTDSFGISIK